MPYVRAVTNDPVIDVVGELLEVSEIMLLAVVLAVLATAEAQ